MKEIKKCDLCNNKKLELLFKNYDRMYGFPEEFNLVKCKSCGLIFINHSLNKEKISKYYPKKKYYSLNKNPVEDQKIRIYKIFYSQKNKFKKLLFRPLKFMVRKSIIKKGENLLDIGCGDGKFLNLMKEHGMNCYGVEPNNKKSVIKKGFKIINSELEEAKFKKEFFETITLNHVLEHVMSPSATLKEIHRILKPKGKVIIATPNINSITAKIFKNKWFQLDTPRHLFLYSKKTIQKYAEKEGFKIDKITYNSTPLQFSCSLIYLLNEFKKKKILLSESKIHLNKIIWLFLLPATYLVNFLHQGDQFEITLSKK